MRTCEVIEDGARCPRKHFGHGYCHKHYQRVKRHGDPLIVLKQRRESRRRKSMYPFGQMPKVCNPRMGVCTRRRDLVLACVAAHYWGSRCVGGNMVRHGTSHVSNADSVATGLTQGMACAVDACSHRTSAEAAS